MFENSGKDEIEKEKKQGEPDKSPDICVSSEAVPVLGVEKRRCTENHASISESEQKIETKDWKLSDFHIERRLGHGQYGKVYLVHERATKCVYAMKKQLRDVIAEIMVWREVGIQRDLYHQNILRSYGYFHDDKQVFIILEYAPNGSLRKRLDKQPGKRFDEKFAARCIYSCADALSYLHERDIIHRDVKPDNILLAENDEVKLADFGLSVNTQNQRRRTICGTPDYIPPEIMNGEPYSKEVDIWSLGVLSYDLLVGEWAFKSENKDEQYWKTVKGEFNQFPDFLAQTARHLIRRLIVVDPKCRLTLSEIKTHPWIIANTQQT